MSKKKLKIQSVQSAQSREEVVSNIARMGVLKREIARLNAELDDKVTSLKEECDRRVTALEAEMKVLIKCTQTWCESNRADLTDNHRKKFADLSTGVVRWRMNPPSVSVSQKNLEQVIDRLLFDPKYKRFVRQKHEVNRELILQHSEMFEDGQIDGIKIKKGEEQFVIEPNSEDVGSMK